MYYNFYSRGLEHFSLELVCILLLINTCEALPRAGKCNQNEFKCRNGECINRNYQCDGDHDCRDGSDEHSCDKIRCPYDNQFRCGYKGRCISTSWVCNGAANCADGSDEANQLCNKAEATSKPQTKSTQKITSTASTTSAKNESSSNTQTKLTEQRTSTASTTSVKTEAASQSQAKSTQKRTSITPSSIIGVKTEAAPKSQTKSTQKISSTILTISEVLLSISRKTTDIPQISSSPNSTRKPNIGLLSRRSSNTQLIVSLLAGVCCILLLTVVISVILCKCRKNNPNSTILLSGEEERLACEANLYILDDKYKEKTPSFESSNEQSQDDIAC